MTYLSRHLIANKTLELVYENAPECTILKFKKNQNNFSFLPLVGKRTLCPHTSPPRHLDSRAFGTRPPLFFDKSNTGLESGK